MDLTLGNKIEVKAKVRMAEIEVEGREEPMRIATFDDAVPLIGIDTLETLGSKVNLATAKSKRSVEDSSFTSTPGAQSQASLEKWYPSGV